MVNYIITKLSNINCKKILRNTTAFILNKAEEYQDDKSIFILEKDNPKFMGFVHEDFAKITQKFIKD